MGTNLSSSSWGGEEVMQALGKEAAVQGEEAQGLSKSAKRRARKQKVQRQEWQHIKSGRVMKEEVKEAKARRGRGQREGHADKRVEDLKKNFEKQREEDVRGWERRFQKMEERIEELENEIKKCFKKKARNGGAGSLRPRKCEGDPRRAQPRV